MTTTIIIGMANIPNHRRTFTRSVMALPL